jgi:2-polyprenyl-3-methyl-5-hydroxy-6-metoxy-1,4-benzoquinol methylase
MPILNKIRNKLLKFLVGRDFDQLQAEYQLIVEQNHFMLDELKRINELRGDFDQLQAEYKLTAEQNHFISYELRRLNESLRYHLLGNTPLGEIDQLQTRSSFDYQWADFHTGIAMSNDPTFMSQVQTQICQMTDLPANWFSGKNVVDVGCGAGRFTYGMLSMGALVTACDQSEAGLRQTAELSREFSDHLVTKQINLLEWQDVGQFDLVFCFGVVHHTGNTYLAIRNAAQKVKPGGRLFLMIYGFPETLSDFIEINSYEELREKVRPLSFEAKKDLLIEQFGPQLAHGWFDAVSPRINDLLTFPEIADVLVSLGFQNIKRTMSGRNHHLVADKL